MKLSERRGSLIGRCTDVGKIREVNEDNLGDLPVDGGHVLIVADGMGGYRGGAIASRLVVEACEEYFHDAELSNPQKAIHEAICLANERIHMRGQQDEELSRMGSTAVVAIVRRGFLYIGHVGDSRIYLQRAEDGLFQRLTCDHTVVQHFVKVGLLTEEEAEGHPDGHILSRALGPRTHVEPEVREDPIRMYPGDRVLLCSDGLSKMVMDAEVDALISGEYTPQELAERLVAEANACGGDDNITVIVFEYHPSAEDEDFASEITAEYESLDDTAVMPTLDTSSSQES